MSAKLSFTQESAFPRIVPFILFMAFIAVQEGMQYLGSNGIVGIPDNWFLYLYPVKTLAVGALLFAYRKNYSEIKIADLGIISKTVPAIILGIAVFALWVNMDWSWATMGTPKGFNPTTVSDIFTRQMLVVFRIVGASVIVPIMEELFWRSWLLRYLICQEFQSVELGKFSTASFIIGAIMFGLEHNLWLAGIMAGAAYSLLLYRTRSLVQCILAHAITNFALGLYVLQTSRWEFW
ncbi:CAAX amino terminal protease self- immunity [Geobacter sp. OR-1]|uniref:CAAX prenyl protease-related protein n=1 Tax=Geobacter sp. OR-1 TaxID=1266765 RepID=UPI000543EE84|nr:CAAX prenyl protease-related protein [Geobacter sp. OR-1]GAM10605.1 CAAX amino terminal protease self- immunity [Geobacter sp. OR-1]